MNAEDIDFKIKHLGKDDVMLLQKLIHVFRKVFEMEDMDTASESYLKSQLQNAGFIAFVVLRDSEVLGGLTAFLLPMYYAEYPELFIYDIAIETKFQRKGLGKKLLSYLRQYCRENGIREMFVQAHQEDEHAIEFYHSTGGKAEKVLQFIYNTGG